MQCDVKEALNCAEFNVHFKTSSGERESHGWTHGTTEQTAVQHHKEPESA